MSKLHVTQISGFLLRLEKSLIDMRDCSGHSDATQLKNIFLTRALAALAVSSLTESPIETVVPFITDGSNDNGIDLIYYDKEEKILYLVQSKWHENGFGSIEQGDMLKFISGVKKVLGGDLTSMNSRIKNLKQDIDLALFDANAKFVLVIVHTGSDELSLTVRSELENFVESQNDTSDLMSIAILSQSAMHKAVAAGLLGAPIALDLSLASWGQLREPHQAFYGQVNATEVALWYEKHGNSLFVSNIRQFISRSIVNEDIKSTLIKRPTDFWYYNNGITVIVNSIIKKPIGGNSQEFGIFECSGFSVVNGAQTVGAIHAAHRQHPDEVAKASVSIRVISVADSPTEFGSNVTKNTNTQNAIEKRDFVALDPQQARLKQELQFEKIEYVYKTGTSPTASEQSFDLTDATVALACAHSDISMAVQAKREIGRLWDDISKAPYTQLFNAGLTGPHLWEVVQTARAINRGLEAETSKYSGRDALVCVHGNRFIQAIIFRELEFSNKISFQKIEKSIIPTLEKTVAKVLLAVGSNFSEGYPASLFKNLTKCRELVVAIT